ncbi:CGCGG family rSAM-modified RiPP protein [Bacillus shivajii]|uniref:CGCGG family putative rSAM-modified RiPP protein n=1 Tax=Bacillus shivajii TaxID=1983719 RepID=UPI001CF97C74|nr:CGCGG family rSAM-modified RiPP protein [Bacillus shivajii]UCZ54257.1 CGCGG family rSAM-modified RiPP protein [Bacillus shivajii]
METKSWSASLEHGGYAENKDLVIEHSIVAVEETSEGTSVNLVTPNEFGNPETYLKEILEERFGESIHVKYIDQCGCGGYVLRVYK